MQGPAGVADGQEHDVLGEGEGVHVGERAARHVLSHHRLVGLVHQVPHLQVPIATSYEEHAGARRGPAARQSAHV